MCSRSDDPSQHDDAPGDWPEATRLRAELTCRTCGARAYSVGPNLSDRCYGCDRHPVLCSCRPERQATLELAETFQFRDVPELLGWATTVPSAEWARVARNRSLREWLDDRAEEVRSGRPARR